ncbi:MAG: hypothetical protein DSZ05_07870 [Sulfurospirillum sp.]|nr:MAG: hypothetical protein DSZ05_07870 [Sulfurospirillum sp.]
MEIGKIVLASLVIEHGKKDEFKALTEKVKTLEEMYDLEKKVFGITNEEVTAILLNDWNFDPVMYNAIKHINNPEEAEDDVRECAEVLQVVKTVISTQPLHIDENLPRALQLVEQYKLDKPGFEEVVKEVFQMESV